FIANPSRARVHGSTHDAPWSGHLHQQRCAAAQFLPETREAAFLAACSFRYCAYARASTAWLVICIRISSLTCGTKLPRPKSERFSVVWASNPTVGRLVLGLVPILTIVTSRVTGLVTPWRVRSPMTLS